MHNEYEAEAGVVLHPNVKLGFNVSIGRMSVIGQPPRGVLSGALAVLIGDDSEIRSHSVIYAGNVIGFGFQGGHGLFLREGNRIGDNVSIGTKTIVEHHVQIGSRVRIHSQAFIPEYSILEDDCWIGPNAVLTNADYPASRRSKDHLRGVLVRCGARIGANATILPGVVIGEGSLIGAGSVVTCDVEPGTVVVGNPARMIKQVRDLAWPDGTSVYGKSMNGDE
jgi:acetyltransferase-like isoleucine patch superfamily enzyme